MHVGKKALVLKQLYTVLEIQFRYVNYALVARLCKNFEKANRVSSAVPGESTIQQFSKSMKLFESNFYLQLYTQFNKTVFFNIISSHIDIIYQKWVACMKIKLYLDNEISEISIVLSLGSHSLT